MSWMTKDWTQGELNALVKKLGGEQVARGILSGTVKFTVSVVDAPNYQPYLHPTQEKGGRIKGFDLEAHLKETGLLDRCFSLEDELVKNWIANPTSYPEEFKGKAIFLWKSVQRHDDYLAPYLIWDWDEGGVIVNWSWLENMWDDIDPALLASI